MRTPSRRTVARAAGAAALILTGLTGLTTTGATAGPAVPALTGTYETIDDLFAAVTTERVPEFGGLYVDEATNSVVVHTTNASPSAAQAARDVVAAALPASDLDGLTVRTVKARYDFASLKGWLDDVTPGVLGLQGAVSTDVDDARNRIVIGVEDVARDRAAVELQVTRRGVPRDAVVVEQVEAPSLEQTLPAVGTVQDPFRPVIGGIQMSFDRPDGEYVCTIAFPAVRSGVTGFVSNSHCNEVQGGVQDTLIYQPFWAAGVTWIGTETVDPTYVAGGSCPAGRVCRSSDSAFYASSAHAPTEQGSIARTEPGAGIAWNFQNKWSIVAEGDAVVGQTIVKQGRTTGRTSGPVDGVCVNANVAATTITLLCQSRITGDISDGGDSGSPFFSASGTDATLRGINWGSSSTNTYYSPISAVQSSGEIGSLTNCASGFGC